MKKRLGDDTPSSGTLPPLRTNGLLKLNPESVLEYRELDAAGNRVKEALVKCRDLPEEESIWECVEQLRMSFPTLNLEDKIIFGGRCNDATTAGDGEVEEEEANVEEDIIQEPNRRTSTRTKIPN